VDILVARESRCIPNIQEKENTEILSQPKAPRVRFSRHGCIAVQFGLCGWYPDRWRPSIATEPVHGHDQSCGQCWPFSGNTIVHNHRPTMTQNPNYFVLNLRVCDQVKQLRDENSRLKKLIGDLSLDKDMLQSVIRKNFLGS
jgi:putative transposase